jgi:hypothetical protein
LREEKSVVAVLADVEAVDAYLDLAWIPHRAQGGKHGNLDLQVGEFAGGHRGKPRVSRGG